MNEKEKQLELEKAMKTCDKAWRTYGKAAAQLESYSKAWRTYVKRREACNKAWETYLKRLKEIEETKP